MRRKSRSRSEWMKLCAEYERSGQTARTFAASRDLNPKTLLWWRSMRTASERKAAPVPRFVEVVEATGPVQESGLRVVVRMGDVVVEVAGLPPAAWIRELAEAC